jgi:hypothetical protein
MMTKTCGRISGSLMTCLIFVALALAGCDAPEAPAWRNSADPNSADYLMPPPQLGAIDATTGSRQITIHVVGIDPYATLVFFERKNGSVGAFLGIGSSPANQASFVDMVPDSIGPVLYYRVRSGTAAGALSPYSPAVHFSIP